MSEQSSGRVRASDAEREEVASVLRHAMGEGRLTLSEGEERLAAVYATTYRDELPPVVADLPPASQAGPDGGAASGQGERSHPPRGRRTGPGLLVVVAAVLAGVWAVAGSGPVWLAIMLGIFAIMSLKHRARAAHCSPHRARATSAS